MTSIAAIIVGIDGWEQYTEPLLRSLYENGAPSYVVVDNASVTPYLTKQPILRTNRLCYSAAINKGKEWADDLWGPSDWYIVLSNDVLCTGPFAHILAEYDGGDLVGPCLKQELGFDYLEGWCVAVPRAAWVDWDERFLGSDYEDVAYSTSARQRGYGLVEDLPFVHLDQRQRYHIVEDFAGKNAHNRELFLREYAKAVPA
jgi:hypothetical protein